jgi:hypothetical protein
MEVMKLNDFLTAENTSMGNFAKTVGTTTATISRISDGIVVPRKDLMQRINVATRGLVTPNDLVGIYCTQACPNIEEQKKRESSDE